MGVLILPRSDWGAKHANGDIGVSLPLQGVFLHHTAGASPSTPAAIKKEMISLETTGWRRFSTNANPQGISYSFVVFEDGTIVEGVSIGRRGAHTAGRNSVVAGIAFAGNYDNQEPSPTVLENTAQLVAYGRSVGWWTGSILGGHRDIKATACPGANIYNKIPWLRSRVTEIVAGTGGAVNVIPVSNVTPTKPKPKPHAPKGLSEDGDFGPLTKKALQRALGVTADGSIGPITIKALQRHVGASVDGSWGPLTTKALQRHLHVKADGKFGPISTAALQRRLNAGTF